jgi:PIN domain nuclease of toxin-antitoxin system
MATGQPRGPAGARASEKGRWQAASPRRRLVAASETTPPRCGRQRRRQLQHSARPPAAYRLHPLAHQRGGGGNIGIRQPRADQRSGVLLSVVSLWEIAIRWRSGKLRVSVAEVTGTALPNGFRRLPFEDRHFAVLAGLPTHDRDPFNHPLLARAIAEGATLVTGDRPAAAYPA